MKLVAALSVASLALARAQGGLETFQEQYNKNVVEEAITGLLIDRDAGAIEQYFDEGFVQHAANIADGRDALYDYQANLPENFTYAFGGIFGEGPFVFTHGRATGLEGGDLIVGSAFKVDGGLITEMWELTQPEVPASESANGNPMWPVTADRVVPSDNEKRNRALVLDFTKRIFAYADGDAVSFTSGADYIQHNPTAPNGVEFSLLAIANLYEIGQVTAVIGGAIADGDYVVLLTEFAFPGYPGFEDPFFAFDVYRLDEAGVIVEHWDITTPKVPIETTASLNYQFPLY